MSSETATDALEPADSPESDRLDLEAIVDADGSVVEGETIDLLLEDDVVVTARVRQLQTGGIECPLEDCFRRFETTKGMRSHVGRMHPEERVATCPTCGEDFEQSNPDRTYCSTECYRSMGSTKLVCEGCGAVFEVKESHADDRKYCTKECFHENGQDESAKISKTCPTCEWSFETYQDDRIYCSRECWRNRETGNSRVEKECPECGDVFEHYPSSEQTYCSRDCHSASAWETVECPMCEDEFERRANNRTLASTHCSRWCSYEASRVDERPDHPRRLLVELVDEFEHADRVVARAYAHLSPAWTREDVALYYALVDTGDYRNAVDAARENDNLDVDVDDPDAAVDRLFELVAMVVGEPNRISAATLREGLSEAGTLYELGEHLTVSRELAVDVAKELGVREDFRTPAAADVDLRRLEGGDET